MTTEEALREAARFAKLAASEHRGEVAVATMYAQISLAHSQLAAVYLAEARA